MRKLACALVGFGGIGHHHASRYARCKNVRLVAICDIDPARLAAAEQSVLAGQKTSFVAAQDLLDTYFNSLRP